MDVADAIRARVSVKEYAPTPVPRDRIEALLDLAVQVPNHRMTEPLEFRVMGEAARHAYARALAERKARRVEDPEAARGVVERVVSRTMQVPAMIGVLVAEDADPEIREEDYATAFMAIQNISLAAVEMDLGTHIKTGAVMSEPSLREALAVVEDQRLVAILFLGVPAERPTPRPRVPAQDRTRWLE
jgi:nitroreductase